MAFAAAAVTDLGAFAGDAVRLVFSPGCDARLATAAACGLFLCTDSAFVADVETFAVGDADFTLPGREVTATVGGFFARCTLSAATDLVLLVLSVVLVSSAPLLFGLGVFLGLALFLVMGEVGFAEGFGALLITALALAFFGGTFFCVRLTFAAARDSERWAIVCVTP